jgi:hypothetical protein
MDFDQLMVWMEPSIDAGYEAPAFDADVAREFIAAAGRSEGDHVKLLRRWNGFYALGGLLHVLGACVAPPNHSLREWNDPAGWRSAWGLRADGLAFFAQDAFGDQFAYRGGKVVRFRVATGTVDPLHATLREWIEAVLLEPDYVLPRKLFESCVQLHGPLPRGGHFAPVGPVSESELSDPARYRVVPTRDNLEMRAVTASTAVRRASSSIRLPKG